MVAVDSVDVLFHRLVALCLAENNDQRNNVKTEPVFVFDFLCLHVCARVNMKV